MYSGAALALVGVVLAITLSYVHAQIDKHAGAYTSFCNVNDSVNCDRVLASPFADFAGLPVAWWAIFAYSALAAAFFSAGRAAGARRHTSLRLAALGSVGATAFSLYMAAVSLFVLGTVCLLCTGLYVVTASLMALVVMARPAYKAVGGRSDAILPGGLPGSLGAAIAGVAAVAVVSWPGTAAIALSPSASLETIRASDEQFFEWYMSLPLVDRALSGTGETDKPVTIVEFSDFECHFCAKNHAALTALKARLGGLVNIVYRHFPLDAACNDALKNSMHRNACRAAQAAECAGAQGRFHEMCDALFENQQRLFDAMIDKIAARLELDTAAFSECMAGDASLKKVLADARAGNRLKITSTPTLFINGRMVTGTFEDAAGYDRAVLIEARMAEGHTLD
jgi:uncharacterized membrane protein/predicted DsbA family dithiol-disulfide isomerase